MAENKWGYYFQHETAARPSWAGNWPSIQSAIPQWKELSNYSQYVVGPIQLQSGPVPNIFNVGPAPMLTKVQVAISDECDSIRNMLIEKNKKYGNSALEPQRIASKASVEEQLLVRIDDKLSRWKTAAPGEDEDIVKDLIGYLILLRVSRKK